MRNVLAIGLTWLLALLPLPGWGHGAWGTRVQRAAFQRKMPPPDQACSSPPEWHHATAHRLPQGERDHGAALAGPRGPDRNKDQGGCQQSLQQGLGREFCPPEPHQSGGLSVTSYRWASRLLEQPIVGARVQQETIIRLYWSRAGP